eukprot:TRINITY_DN6308_c0_g1_i1.p1 TRINITY_DN6308_c0_g1~~TRINITY_DN6308_c0_g1_i1.p1  ORF type:complete len:440 (+),score=62.09 TRINITY_DN6308_c0_g1_i1:138-1457(+)
MAYKQQSALTTWLEGRPAWQTTYTTIVVSLAYITGSYFQKYPVFLLDNSQDVGPLQLKVWISISTTAGYALSKIPAYSVVSTMPREKRKLCLILLILGMLVLSNGLYAVVPDMVKPITIFLGCLPASWVFGIMFTYLEGRRSTEVTSGLLNFFIILGGALARAVGNIILNALPSSMHTWMPLVTAGAGLPIAIVGVFLLDAVPQPSLEDVRERAMRRPMPASERNAFLKRFWPGLLLLAINYMLMVTFRSFRDYFCANVYKDMLRREVTSLDYILADWPAGAIACTMMMCISSLHNNRAGVQAMHVMMVLGAAVLAAVTVLFQISYLSGEMAVICIGIGLYVSWLPSQAILFDRILSASDTSGTSVFLIFATDGLGYVGTLGLLFYKSFADVGTVTDLFLDASLGLAGSVAALSIASIVYFNRKLPANRIGYELITDTN